ncbi:MAG: helix-turn-helix domain-containing protein [Flavobacteriaceae bacterium]|jgi:transcriptional regulator with XRE-family HTH domain|nr:helix-turn-helix domain-containing protein [Flavobacteriaceae bacterium]
MKLGNKLKGLRVEKGLSTIQVADMLDVSESTYRRYEADKSFPDVFILDKIAKIYDKNLIDLLPEGMTIINNNNGEYSNNAGYIVNQYLSEKLTEQYEVRLAEKDKQIEELREMINRLMAKK